MSTWEIFLLVSYIGTFIILTFDVIRCVMAHNKYKNYENAKQLLVVGKKKVLICIVLMVFMCVSMFSREYTALMETASPDMSLLQRLLDSTIGSSAVLFLFVAQMSVQLFLGDWVFNEGYCARAGFVPWENVKGYEIINSKKLLIKFQRKTGAHTFTNRYEIENEKNLQEAVAMLQANNVEELKSETKK